MHPKFDKEKEFLEDYASGKGTSVLARKYGTTATTLSRVLRRNGICARRAIVPLIKEHNLRDFIASMTGVKFKLIKYYQAEKKNALKVWLEAYVNGEQASKWFGVSVVTFRFALRRYGLKYPKVHAWTLKKYYKFAYG